MGACAQVKKWIEENVQIPVERVLTQFREVCEEYKKLVEEQVQQPVEQWVSELRQTCVEQSCNWWCLCCNKWLCWLAWVVVKIVTWVVVMIAKWVVYLACKIVAFVVTIIEMVVVTIGKWVVVFVTCLVTDPVAALKSFRDLWTGLLDIAEFTVDFAKGLIDNVAEIVSDVGSLLETLLSAIPYVGPILAGLVRWVTEWVRDVLDWARDLVSSIQDVVFGILRLNGCRVVSGLAGVGIGVVRPILIAFRAVGGIGGGIRDAYDLDAVEDIVASALRETFGDDAEGLRLARRKVRINQRPFGLPVVLDVRRFFVSSRSDTVDLRALHDSGVLNLSAAANFMTDCSQRSEKGERAAFLLNHARWEVVYAGTDTPVDYRTIRLFLEQGPAAVPEFHVFSMSRDVLRRLLYVARRKGFQLGVDFSWTIGAYEVTRADEFPVPDTNAGNDAMMTRVGRSGAGDDLCTIPSLGIFRYDLDERNGLTSWNRAGDVHPSGVTFRDRLPEWVFRYVLVHELGHYLGLDHEGHDGVHQIMYSNKAGLEFATPAAVAEYLLLTGEPRFSTDDARTVWAWITSRARPCLT